MENINQTQFCKGCKEEHSIEEFYIRKKTGKPRAECKKCFNAKQMERFYKNKEKYKNKSKNYYLKNKEHIKQKVATYRKENKEKIIADREMRSEKQKLKTKLIKEERLKNKKPITERFCSGCSKTKNINEFYNKKYKCIICYKKYVKDYVTINGYKPRKNQEKYRAKVKRYLLKNKEKIAKRKQEYEKNRKKTDISFKLRCYLSCKIKRMISKKDTSCLKYLDYTPRQLKEHLESLFEPWMNWQNHGQYLIKDWKDNDQSTWKWQIDHIIPCSILPFTSMEDENFKICWALNNLRPLSAKQNLLDGVNKTRHKIKDNNVI